MGDTGSIGPPGSPGPAGFDGEKVILNLDQ